MAQVNKQFGINFSDILKGLVMAVLTPAAFVVQQSIQLGSLVFDWKTIGMAAVGGGLAYLVKNFLSPTHTVVKGVVSDEELSDPDKPKPIKPGNP